MAALGLSGIRSQARRWSRQRRSPATALGGLPIDGLAVRLAGVDKHDVEGVGAATPAVGQQDGSAPAEIDLGFCSRGTIHPAEQDDAVRSQPAHEPAQAKILAGRVVFSELAETGSRRSGGRLAYFALPRVGRRPGLFGLAQMGSNGIPMDSQSGSNPPDRPLAPVQSEDGVDVVLIRHWVPPVVGTAMEEKLRFVCSSKWPSLTAPRGGLLWAPTAIQK